MILLYILVFLYVQTKLETKKNLGRMVADILRI